MAATAIVPANHRTHTATEAAIMHDVAYALGIAAGYRQALATRGVSVRGERILEVGPGPTLGAAVSLATLGAIVTAADLYPAQWDPQYHAPFYTALRRQLPETFPDADVTVVTAMLEHGSFEPAVHLIEAGAEDLHVLASGGFAAVLSNAVLEHVRDVPRALFQLARVTAPGGMHLHQVDFRDHRDFTRPLEYLTIDSRRFAPLFTNQRGECGNRWRHSQFLTGFGLAGFHVEAFEPNLFAAPDYQVSVRGRLAREFAALEHDDLHILSGCIAARRCPGPAMPVAADIGPPTPAGNMASARNGHGPSGRTAPARIAPLTIPRPRILVFRSCRMPQFARTLAWIRDLTPDAEVVALSHEGHQAALLAAGVDRVVEVPGRRFGIRGAGFGCVRQLQRLHADRVVIPQIDNSKARHSNLYRLAAAAGAPSIVPFGPSGPLAELVGVNRWWHAAATSIAALQPRLDVSLMLLLLCVARLVPRRRPVARPDERPLRVLHIISSWGVGGAQAQLAQLIDRTPTDKYEVEVLVLGESDGEFSFCRLGRTDIQFRYLDRFPSLAPAILEIAALCRHQAYDIVHTWLFYANFLGAAGARLAGVPHVVSGVRNLSLWKRAWPTRWWYRLADALGSRLPDRLTVNASALVDDHARWALIPGRRLDVVPNGLDPLAVREGTAGARTSVRAELGLPDDAILFGTVGRLAPEKDQQTFLRVAARVLADVPGSHAVIVGDGPCRSALEQVVRSEGIDARVHFLGARTDSRRIIAGLDALLLTSLSEGFPNVLLEAALLDTPALSTDVGGATDVLDGQCLFPAGDIDRGAKLLCDVLTDPAAARLTAGRLRLRAEALYSADRMANHWFALYDTATERTTVNGRSARSPGNVQLTSTDGPQPSRIQA